MHLDAPRAPEGTWRPDLIKMVSLSDRMQTFPKHINLTKGFWRQASPTIVISIENALRQRHGFQEPSKDPWQDRENVDSTMVDEEIHS